MRKIFIGALAVVGLSCGGTDEPSTETATNTISFQFSGDTSGTFTSSGRVTSQNVNSLSGSSAGVVQNVYGNLGNLTRMLAFGWMPAGAKTNGMTMVAPQFTGTFGYNYAYYSVGQAPPSGNANGDVTFYVGTQLGDTLTGRFYRLESGTFTISEVSATRVRGTFAGSGHLYNGNARDAGRAVTITNGTIDLGGDGGVIDRASSIGGTFCVATKLC